MIRLSNDLSAAVEGGATVLVPSRQHAERLRLAYAAAMLARGRRTWNTPDVLTVDAWVSRELERRAAAGERLPRLLTPAESWLLWRQATDQLTQEIEDLLGRGHLADALSRSSQLAAEYGIDVSRLKASPATESRLLAEAQEIVDRKLQALTATSIAQVKTSHGCLGDSGLIVLAGFLHVSPYLKQLVQQRSACGYETRIRPSAADRMTDPQVILAADSSEELERIALWCRDRLVEQGDHRLLVMAPGSPAARERLASLIRQVIRPECVLTWQQADEAVGPVVSIEGGEPLARAPLVDHALLAITWLTEGCEFERWSEWLRAPYWSTPDPVSRSRLDVLIRERAPLEISVSSLLTQLSKARPQLDHPAQQLSERIRRATAQLDVRSASPRDWSERFHAALEALGWPGDRVLSSEEQQTCMRFTELLDEFGALTTHAGSISRGDAVRWLGELAARTSFRPAAGDALVTLTAHYVDPLVHYDGIWVSGLHSDAWPSPVQADPFLPLDAQVAAGVPQASAAGQEAIATALMEAWRSASDNVILSAPLYVDDVEVAPSSLLRRWQSERQPLEQTVWLPARLRREGMLEKIHDDHGPPWPLDVPVPSGTRAVELQNNCPFRAYAELRLGCTKMEAPEPGVPATNRGKLLHSALEKLWAQVRTSDALVRMPDHELDQLIEACVDRAAEDTLRLPDASRGSPVEARERRRAGRLIRQLCDLERKRAPFRVKQTEFDQTILIAGASLRIRIDRIDELADGGVAILDYKSGRAAPFDWYGERPSHPQLLTYLAAVGDSTSAMATVAVNAREVRFSGVAASGKLLPKVQAVDGDWRERQREWKACVEKLVADFAKGRAVVDPTPKACMFCQVISLCRIAERKDYVEETPDE